MDELVAVDVGGTHARFAIASVAAGRVTSLGEFTTLRTLDHPGFESAFNYFGERLGREVPRAASIAVAACVRGDVISMTNTPWVIRRSWINEQVEHSRFTLVNDLGAVAHSVTQLNSESFDHISGDNRDLPMTGIISVVGPGTGLGVAQLIRRGDHYKVVECEGGHVGFCPTNEFEDRLVTQMRRKHGRVSVERLVSGAGLIAIYEALAPLAARGTYTDPKLLWTAALAGEDACAAAALDQFCFMLGSFAGDIALAQGAHAVVIGGGLGLRLAAHLPRSRFSKGFTSKGRFTDLMTEMPVKLIKHPEPAVLGAAAAFARDHRLPS